MCTSAARREVLLGYVLGNEPAAQFLDLMWDVAHTWDDLIDGDKAVAPAKINQIFIDLLMRLPRNPFYAKHFDYLNPIIANSFTNWQVATELERGTGEYEQRIAYILRSSYVDLVVQCALLLGGTEYAVKVGTDIRKLAHAETWEGYQQNLAAEAAARETKSKE